MKIIENNKDYMDQSIDEIKLLRYINCNGDADDKNVLKIFDSFYHKEHLFLVTELLKDNLYEFYKYNRENEAIPYFSIGRLQKVYCIFHPSLKDNQTNSRWLRVYS